MLQNAAVNHVALNLKMNRRPVKQVLQELAEYVLPTFPSVDGRPITIAARQVQTQRSNWRVIDDLPYHVAFELAPLFCTKLGTLRKKPSNVTFPFAQRLTWQAVRTDKKVVRAWFDAQRA